MSICDNYLTTEELFRRAIKCDGGKVALVSIATLSNLSQILEGAILTEDLNSYYSFDNTDYIQLA